MTWNLMFFVNSVLLGVGLAMDAFSVSLANGLNEPKMKLGRMSFIAGSYAIFQFAMPMIGWICVHTIITYLKSFERFLPWISLIILLYIGIKMIVEGIRGDLEEEETDKRLAFSVLIIQSLATSIDALSVGFTIADYGLIMAIIASLIIAIVTYFICMVGLKLGIKVGDKFSDKAGVFGGIILVGIGIEIFIKGIFF
ncbi:MAG: manganese efflux pump MntP family protein [Treponema sp.]|nr:manganese efflux pump MntP family protein [Treponema sp.]